MQIPEPSDQVKFLTNLQRLLAEGLFTATYKYALLSALADLCVEHGSDSGAAWTVSLLDLPGSWSNTTGAMQCPIQQVGPLRF